MAQTRSFEFQHLLVSKQLNDSQLAIAPYGVYAGYDLKTNTAGDLAATFTIDNSKVRNNDGILVSVLKMPNGIIVEETADIKLPISAASNFDRIDAIICEHTAINVQDGQQAVYSVIEGTPQNLTLTDHYTLPTIIASTGNVTEGMIIGYLYVQQNSLPGDWLFFKQEVPSAGSELKSAKFSRAQAMQGTSFSDQDIQGADAYGKLDIPTTANVFYINSTTANPIKFLPDFRDNPNQGRQKGVVVTLIIKGASVSFEEVQSANVPKGYKPIKTGLPDGFNQMDNDVSTMTVLSGGVVQLIEETNFWRVLSVIDSLSHPNSLARLLVSSVQSLKSTVLNVIKTNEINPYSVIRQHDVASVDTSGNLILPSAGQQFSVDTQSTISGILRTVTTAGTTSTTPLKEGDSITVRFVSDGALIQSSTAPIVSQIAVFDAKTGATTVSVLANDVITFEQFNASLIAVKYPTRLNWQRITGLNVDVLNLGLDQNEMYFAVRDGVYYLKGKFQLTFSTLLSHSTTPNTLLFNFPTNVIMREANIVLHDYQSSNNASIWGNGSSGIHLRCYLNSVGFWIPSNQFVGNYAGIGTSTYYIDSLCFPIY